MSDRKPPLRVVPAHAIPGGITDVMRQCLELIHPKIEGMHAVLVLLDPRSERHEIEVASTFRKPSDSTLILEDAAREMRKLPSPEEPS